MGVLHPQNLGQILAEIEMAPEKLGGDGKNFYGTWLKPPQYLTKARTPDPHLPPKILWVGVNFGSLAPYC